MQPRVSFPSKGHSIVLFPGLTFFSHSAGESSWSPRDSGQSPKVGHSLPQERDRYQQFRSGLSAVSISLPSAKSETQESGEMST